ncbi:TIGR04255 family protein [bacterium]|nr:TIGR04255 family protein [bacterium]
MNTVKYKFAPISEVILGITFKERFWEPRDILKIEAKYIDDFPEIERLNPIANVEFRNRLFEYTLVSNTAIGLTRMRTYDGNWLLQFQGNKLLLNWIRKDENKLGGYPGFDLILDKFEEILKVVSELIEKKINLEDIKYVENTYLDRADINNTTLKNIFKLNEFDIKWGINSINKNSSFVLDNGRYLSQRIGIVIQPGNNRELINIENTIYGYHVDQLKKWYIDTRKIQNEIFEDLITDETLKEWK